jgi:hypothetical protein
MVDWNLIATISIISFLLLWVASKMMGLTIFEMLEQIKDFFGDKKETIQEKAIEIYE